MNDNQIVQIKKELTDMHAANAEDKERLGEHEDDGMGSQQETSEEEPLAPQAYKAGNHFFVLEHQRVALPVSPEQR